MDWIRLELIVELIIVFAAPPIYQYYLWRSGKTTPAQLRKTLKIFLPFYIGMIAVLIAWVSA
jgi:ABC-type Fe3+-siderophore transport system permease subunit